MHKPMRSTVPEVNRLSLAATSAALPAQRARSRIAAVRPQLARQHIVTFLAFVLILLLTYLAHGLLHRPMLYGDDWQQGLENLMTHSVGWLNWENRRPLLFAPFLLQYTLFGTNLAAYSVILLLMNAATALLVYLLSANFDLVHGKVFALAISMFVLVYPANYTQMWFTMLHGFSALLLGLLSIYLFLLFARAGSWRIYFAAMVCLWLSFLMYEIHAGLVMAWICFLLYYFRRASSSVRLGLLFVIVQILLYAFVRVVGYQALGINDEYLSQLDLTPQLLMMRLVLGYKIIVGWSWTSGARQLWRLPQGNLTLAAAITAVSLSCGWFTMQFYSRTAAGRNEDQRLSANTKSESKILVFRQYGWAALIGLAVIGAGYVPVISAYEPNLTGIGSRFNLVAIIGGALFLCSLLMLAAQALASCRQQVRVFFVAACLPLLLLGASIQAAVKLEDARTWQEQKQIWQALFEAAPDLKANAQVLLVLPGFEDRFAFETWRRPPFVGWWDVASGVRLLYNKPSLTADVLYLDVESGLEPALTAQGVFNAKRSLLTPYRKVVAFAYDPAAQTMKQIVTLPAEWAPGVSTPVYLCDDCVLAGAKPDAPLRRLLQ